MESYNTYNKFKEMTPEETIFRIRRILHEAGFFPVLKWNPEEFSGMLSNRVELDGMMAFGTNGKGTDERYAEASAFAELAERIQNNLLNIKGFGPRESPYSMVPKFPDEKIMSIDQLVSQKDPFLEGIFHNLGMITLFQKISFLRVMAERLYERNDDTVPVIPFTDPAGSRIVWLPEGIITIFCGSNGMCAGNTMEEALVQGFSEIIERYSQLRIMKEGLTPPEIPAAELKKYSLWPLICQIEATGRYKVSVRDCSLGEGLPVAAVLIADRQRGTFGIKFGCHPSFPVSVERTLTEALQGKRLEQFASMNAAGTEEQVLNYDNYVNTAKTGNGFYRASLLGKRASWEYQPWIRWGDTGNRDYLIKILKLLTDKGFTPLIRDASHLGFPSYFIIVPGMSEMFEQSMLRIRDFRSNVTSRRAFRHFPKLSPQEEDNLLRLILFKEASIIENGLDNLSGLYLKGGLFTADRVGACLALKKGRYQLAARLFQKCAQLCEAEKDGRYFRCMAEFARILHTGASREDALASAEFLYGEETAQRIDQETRNPETMMEIIFPKLNCFDCENCPAEGIHCEYPKAREVIRKINRALENSTVMQEPLLENLKVLFPSDDSRED